MPCAFAAATALGGSVIVGNAYSAVLCSELCRIQAAATVHISICENCCSKRQTMPLNQSCIISINHYSRHALQAMVFAITVPCTAIESAMITNMSYACLIHFNTTTLRFMTHTLLVYCSTLLLCTILHYTVVIHT